ncbi:ABC transporter substrate-binding protein [Sinanaerobacter sp. ZZT-01]|uniref:ABC transporter substrate-binding protein n=1 Tax=Sinanaerobacter sp. ZZT-01 TaxID=3111540 RepID=UPI002D769819|nr:ABC transporter substrate-binding protein [Sinanaerobacter sp. ZZT-01]WRR93029.1 ABC transporter substrate-binding protein [Sinanaerobacter sp. ZZT-01]
MKMKRILCTILGMILLLSLIGCSSEKDGQGQEGDKDSNEIVVLSSASLDPELGEPTEASTEFSLYEMIYEPLIKYRENGEYQPALAEKWEVSPEGNAYTFYLRKGVKFSDGSDFNANSVIFSAEKWDPKTFSSEMTGIEKIDDYTVKISFKDACYPCLTELTYPRPYRFASQSAYDDSGEFVSMIGTGEWMIESYVSEQEVVLVPNPYYYGKKPNLDKIIIKKVTDGQSRIMALQSGEADLSIADIPEDSLPVVEKDENLAILSAKGTMGFFVMLNEENEVLQDAKVRKALNYATDSETIIENIFNGRGTAAKGLLPDTTPYVTDENSPGYAYNIAEAKKLLSEAGYKDSDGDGIVEKNGKKLSLNLVFQTEEYASWKLLSQFLQSEYAKIGVELKLDLKESAAYYDSIWKNRDFDLILYRTYEDSWNPHGFLRSMFTYTEDTYGICWSDKVLNKDLDEVIRIQDEKKRQEKYDEVLKYLNDQAYTIPIYYPLREYVYNTRLENLVMAPTSYENVEWNLINIKE